MKKLTLLFFASILVFYSYASDKKYESAMQSAIDILYANKSLEDLQKAVTQFERISQAETDKWLPSYYAALGYVWMTHKVEDVTRYDQFLDEAQKHLDNCKGLTEVEDEIATLQGYIYMMRIPVDPPSRGAQYSPMSYGELQKALTINAENPRALLLMGQMKYGTDQFFGNDLSEACNMLKSAAQKFENEQPIDKLSPSWGKSMAQYLSQNCQ